MTQYLLAVHGTDENPYADEAAMHAAFAAVETFNQKLRDAGLWVFGGGLEAASTAVVVDNRAGETLVTDGPYLESKEHIGGFWVIEVPDVETARTLAAEASAACQGKVEVRPFQSE